MHSGFTSTSVYAEINTYSIISNKRTQLIQKPTAKQVAEEHSFFYRTADYATIDSDIY